MGVQRKFEKQKVLHTERRITQVIRKSERNQKEVCTQEKDTETT